MAQKKKTSDFGKLAEDFAAEYLSSNNYKIVERNFYSRFGEIDIIAVKNDTLIFVEVKARWSDKFGAPEEAVTPKKLWKIGKTGEYYSLLHPELPQKLAIEVVSLQIENGKVKSCKIIAVD